MNRDTTGMDAASLQLIARAGVGLALTESEAAALLPAYLALQELIRKLEAVPLPYTDDPFITPAMADRWLEAWPER